MSPISTGYSENTHEFVYEFDRVGIEMQRQYTQIW